MEIIQKNSEKLQRAGLTLQDISALQQLRPVLQSDFETDNHSFSKYFKAINATMGKLPKRDLRNTSEAEAFYILLSDIRKLREEFLTRHVSELYSRLTMNQTRFLKVEDLVYEAAKIVHGLTPSRSEVEADSLLAKTDKEGTEYDQGIFLSHVLANESAGLHLCQAMLLPRPDSMEKKAYLEKHSHMDLGLASVETTGNVSWVTMQNPQFLNAEDDFTVDAVEAAVDLALLDDRSTVVVLRGGYNDHSKYKGRRTFCSGLNVSHLEQGKISYLWYVKREMGFINKMFRGLAYNDCPADEVLGVTLEKPWIAQVDTFAVGGGFQYLLAMDYVVAGSDVFMTLPASELGFIPGAGSLRLPRYADVRMARELILMGGRLQSSSPEAKIICDQVVEPDQVEKAIFEAIEKILRKGYLVNVSNRRAFRISQEPLNLFRQYMSILTRDVAYGLFAPEKVCKPR